MLIDYYQILRVPADADLEAIKKAYRARALECHPDRGGSHEGMLQVIEAFQILANPETRRRYDEARREQFSRSAQDATQADSARARQKAEEYPRDWNEFESWFERDFTSAEYGQWGHLPTVSKSFSGGVFLIGGLALGVGVLYIFAGATGWTGKGGGLLPLLLICAFGAFGLGLHKKIADSMRKSGAPPDSSSPRPNAPPSNAATAYCSRCGQQLRIPSDGKTHRLRCPACKYEFDYPLK